MYQIRGCRTIDLLWYLGGGRTAFREQSENTVLASSQLPASSCSSQNSLTLMPDNVHVNPLSPGPVKKDRQQQLLSCTRNVAGSGCSRPFCRFTD